MAEYFNVTTNLGDAEVAAAITNNSKIEITHIAFGDGGGSVPNPSKSRTTLVREVHRQPVTKYERHPTNSNWIIVETVIPSEIGGFTIREIGIIGNGKLLSHGSHAPFEKVADPSGVSEYRLKFTQNITDGNVVSITLDDSLIFATQAWVEENFIKRSEIVNNLTTDDENKPISAKMAKKLQDEKFARADLVNDFTTGGIDKALTAEQGKALFEMFGKSLNANGYQKLPRGLIIQWLSIIDNSAYGPGALAVNNATFPIAFPNAALQYYITLSNEKFSVGCDDLNKTNINVNALNITSSPSIMARINMLVIGY